MDLESDIPPPPYSAIDPQSQTPASSTMGGGNHSPTSTLRATSSQSMRAPSFITLRGGFLRGVPFSDDPTAHSYFEGRTFQHDPSRELAVLHREITADTTRADLPYPGFEPDRDVTEQDWQTMVNYILTELGNETSSVRHRKKLSAEEFYERQTSIERLIMEWNESFFQPRSIKVIAHYYYVHPRSPAPTYQSRRSEVGPGLRRISISGGEADSRNDGHGHYRRSLGRTGPFNHGSPRRGGANLRGGLLRSAIGLGHQIFDANDNHEALQRRGRHRRGGRDGGRRRNSSISSSSSSSSDSESDTDHRRTASGRTGGPYDEVHPHRRSRSVDSDSSLSSVASISSRDIDENHIGVVREAIANFRLDPTNHQHNRLAYRQLLQKVKDQKKATKRDRSTDPIDFRAVTKTQRNAIKSDLKSLRKEAKIISKDAKRQRRAAQKEAKAMRKQAKEARKQGGNIARNVNQTAGRATVTSDNQQHCVTSGNTRGMHTTAVPQPGYQMPGSFPEAMTQNKPFDQDIDQLQTRIEQLQRHVSYVKDQAETQTKNISNAEKKTVASAAYDQEIKETTDEIYAIQDQMSQLHIANSTESSNRGSRTGPSPIAAYSLPLGRQGEQMGRRAQFWGERFGRDMESWGQQFGRDMERWGEEFGRSMSDRGRHAGRRFA